MMIYESRDLPEEEDGLTLAMIIEHAKANDVPDDAALRYAGCGTHWVQWGWWRQPTQEELDAKIAAEVRRQAEEAPDRELGF